MNKTGLIKEKNINPHGRQVFGVTVMRSGISDQIFNHLAKKLFKEDNIKMVIGLNMERASYICPMYF